MRAYLILFTALIFFSGCKTKNPAGANGVTYKDALDYNNYIIFRQDDIMKDIMAYGNASKISIDEADKSLDKMIADVSMKLKEIKGMPAYNGDSAFRDAAATLFTFYETGFSTDFKEMHQLKRKSEMGTATDTDQQKLLGFSDYIGAKERPLDEKLKETQTKFAKDNNFKLRENDVQKQMENMEKGN